MDTLPVHLRSARAGPAVARDRQNGVTTANYGAAAPANYGAAAPANYGAAASGPSTTGTGATTANYGAAAPMAG